jgi:hypothetical protein
MNMERRCCKHAERGNKKQKRETRRRKEKRKEKEYIEINDK